MRGGDESSQNEPFDGKKFYAKTVAWKRDAQIKAQSPVKLVVESIPKVKKPIVRVKEAKRPEIDTELEDFKRHAASLSKILQQGSPKSSQTVPKRVAVSIPSVKLKTRETSKADLRQALLQAKIAFLESQVSGVLQGSSH
jgi:hypothetical protein